MGGGGRHDKPKSKPKSKSKSQDSAPAMPAISINPRADIALFKSFLHITVLFQHFNLLISISFK